MRRDVLLLQGPIGPFFSRFAAELEERDFVVHKVNLNGGDRFFYRRKGSVDYTGEPAHWAAFSMWHTDIEVQSIQWPADHTCHCGKTLWHRS